MIRFIITNTHGFTPTELQKLKKKETDAYLSARLTTVRLAMEGWTGKEAGQLAVQPSSPLTL